MVKQLVKYLLKRRNLKVWPVTPRSLSGFDFKEDIQKVIPINNPICFDIGASHGQTAESWLTIFLDPCIYSFEPSTSSFAILNEKKFKRPVRIFKTALGSNTGKKEFLNYDQPWLSSFLPLDEKAKAVFNQPKLEGREFVEVDTVDHFTQENKIEKIHLLKSDTQGFDLEVLKGCKRCLSEGLIDSLLIEVNFQHLYEGQSDIFETFQYLQAHGYYLVDFYEKIRIGFSIAWCNALFIKKQP